MRRIRRWLPVLLLGLLTSCEKLPRPPQGHAARPSRAAGAATDASAPAASAPRRRAAEPPGPALPSELERRRAIGDTSHLTPAERAAYLSTSDFDPVPPPGPSDWLALYAEPGQTVPDFRSAVTRNRVTPERQTLYLQPIDELALPGKGALTIAELSAFSRHFFGLPVETLPPRPSSEMMAGSRELSSGRQLLTQSVLSALRARVPKDAYAVLALTTIDLYPGEGWNFVFGQATFRERIGVHSLARYSPAFYGGSRRGADRLVRKRAYTVLAHELGHMFGMEHCPYYHCIMNGSNSLDETDRTPLHLCPVCLRKLQLASGVDLEQRHRRLAQHLRQVGLAASATWHEQRAERLRHPTPDAAENAIARP